MLAPPLSTHLWQKYCSLGTLIFFPPFKSLFSLQFHVILCCGWIQPPTIPVLHCTETSDSYSLSFCQYVSVSSCTMGNGKVQALHSLSPSLHWRWTYHFLLLSLWGLDTDPSLLSLPCTGGHWELPRLVFPSIVLSFSPLLLLGNRDRHIQPHIHSSLGRGWAGRREF